MISVGSEVLNSRGYEELWLLGYNAVQSVESQLAFRKKMWPSFLGSKNKPSKKPEELCLPTCFHAGFLLGLFFDPEDSGELFHRNAG
jgi:hypothetical protein